jgi:hypothetical protein
MVSPTLAQIERAQLRLASIRDDISSRLWHINAGMASDVFNGLMDQMALLQFNCEQRVADEHRTIDRRLGEPDRRALAALLTSAPLAPPIDP